jgi:indolepyruvate ferredoxin oxidoreductase beta subunit
MSQRGGSVITYVRVGEKVASPVLCKGDADAVVAFEELEAYRIMPHLKKGGLVVMSTQQIQPLPVFTGVMKYPEDIVGKIKAEGFTVAALDAHALAVKAGDGRTANVVVIGVLSRFMDAAPELFENAIRAHVAPALADVNIAAFHAGREAL